MSDRTFSGDLREVLFSQYFALTFCPREWRDPVSFFGADRFEKGLNSPAAFSLFDDESRVIFRSHHSKKSSLFSRFAPVNSFNLFSSNKRARRNFIMAGHSPQLPAGTRGHCLIDILLGFIYSTSTIFIRKKQDLVHYAEK